MTNLKELIRICEAATPGPWFVCYSGSSDWAITDLEGDNGDSHSIANVYKRGHVGNPPNSEFIATFNPGLVRKLLDVVIKARQMQAVQHPYRYEPLQDALAELDQGGGE